MDSSFAARIRALFETPPGAAALSFVFPGLGQAAAGSRVRGAIVAIPGLAVLGAFGLLLVFDPGALSGVTADRGWLTNLLILDLGLFLYHLSAVLDAYGQAGRASLDRLRKSAGRWATVLVVGAVLAATVGVHAAAAEVDLGWQHTLDCSSGAVPCWFDISYPQCKGSFPAGAEYGIVGVNKGIVFSPNPCLASGDGPPELTWAGGVKAQLYANTGNPGPALSARWPAGQTSPRQCATAAAGSDTAECAFDYGWNAAADSYKTAAGAYVAVGLASPGATRTPSPNMWWLDVEINNSWRTDVTLNVAALQGEVAYLESVNVAGIGFYSTRYQWNQITGSTTVFSAYPSWVAGAGSAGQAVVDCAAGGFTGGRVALVQYPAGGFDADLLC